MLRRILLILAVLFFIFMISGIIYTKIFGPIDGSATTATPPAASSTSQK